MNNKLAGIFAGAAAAATFGLNPLFGLPLYAAGLTPLSVLFYRFLLSTLMLGTLMLLRRQSFRVPLRQWGVLLSSGILLSGCCLAWFFSFKVMDSGIGAGVLFTYPLMVALLMRCFGEKLNGKTLCGIGLAIAGVAALCNPGPGAKVNAAGVLLVLLSAFTYALYMVEIKVSRLKELPPETLTFYSMALGALFFLLILRCGADLQPIPNLKAAGCALGLAFFPSFLSFLLTAVAIKHIGATLTAILGALEPATAMTAGVLVFGEKFTLLNIAGMLLILASVLFPLYNRRPETKPQA